MSEELITIGDCAVVLQGKNLDKKYLNTEKKGLPYIVGASCLKDFEVQTEKYTEQGGKSEISKLGDVIISTVGTLGKMAVNNIGECVLSKHVCAVRFCSEILPEYGMLCLMASIKNCIPPDDGLQTGFSRKLDISAIEKLPLTLIGINRQGATVEKMLFLGKQFFSMKNTETTIEDLPDDPIELIEQFEKEVTMKLKTQRKALKNIVELIREDLKTDKTDEKQLCLF